MILLVAGKESILDKFPLEHLFAMNVIYIAMAAYILKSKKSSAPFMGLLALLFFVGIFASVCLTNNIPMINIFPPNLGNYFVLIFLALSYYYTNSKMLSVLFLFLALILFFLLYQSASDGSIFPLFTTYLINNTSILHVKIAIIFAFFPFAVSMTRFYSKTFGINMLHERYLILLSRKLDLMQELIAADSNILSENGLLKKDGLKNILKRLWDSPLSIQFRIGIIDWRLSIYKYFLS